MVQALQENQAIFAQHGGRRRRFDKRLRARCQATPLKIKQGYPRRKLARYMLVALEEAHEHKELVDTTTATMEHIMPQTLSDEWKAALGPEYKAVHEKWLDTIGNLTLTGYNSELGNDPFEQKQRMLQNTHFELSRPLLNEEAWGATEIEARGKRLAELAVRRWGRD
ncbi:HNH endonuclease family protein [Ralstonia pseudosolanacearum]|uniref:HNH endonuclease family protein n=1 Tax=Ralstonia pseudosolanacearum TaxID=1310165 RepID=UPI0022789E2D|nr:HNH endonuclease family protein [Ralstonia pseudosolanacearum]